MPDTLLPSVTLVSGDQETGRTSYLFCSYNSETGELGRTFWEIYTISGMERNSAISDLGLFELARTSSRIYAARMPGDSEIMTFTELSECFCLY